MKSNLHKSFKTDSDLEKDGIWLSITDETKFLVRRWGGSNHTKTQEALARYHKPVAHRIKNLSKQESEEILVKSFVHACLVDWKGVQEEVTDDDYKDIPCTPENALQLFTELPDMFGTIFNYASDFESYKDELGKS